MRITEVFYYIVNNYFQQSFSNCQNVITLGVCVSSKFSVGKSLGFLSAERNKKKEKKKKFTLLGKFEVREGNLICNNCSSSFLFSLGT